MKTKEQLEKLAIQGYDLEEGFELLCKHQGDNLSSIAKKAGLNPSTIRRAIEYNNIRLETLGKIAIHTGHTYKCKATGETKPSVKKLLVTMGIK